MTATPEQHSKYNRSEKGRARVQKYKESEKGQRAIKRDMVERIESGLHAETQARYRRRKEEQRDIEIGRTL